MIATGRQPLLSWPSEHDPVDICPEIRAVRAGGCVWRPASEAVIPAGKVHEERLPLGFGRKARDRSNEPSYLPGTPAAFTTP
jgi:hypothetical protein